MRKPVNIGASPRKKASMLSTMAVGGINRRELSQLLDPSLATRMENWLIDAQGQLFRSGQMEKVYDYGDWKEITLFKHWYDDFWVVAYKEVSTGDYYVNVLDLATDTLYDVYLAYTKGAPQVYTAATPVSGQPYGNYFVVGSDTDFELSCYRISKSVLNTVTTPFAANEKITGGTSGATATVLEVNSSNIHLTLGNIQGEFESGETVTGDVAGGGVLTTDMYFTYWNSGLPRALYVYSFLAPAGSSTGARLYAGNHRDDRTLLQFSDVDDGSNPPFEGWATGASVANGGKVYNKNASRLNSITSSGDVAIAGYDASNAGFTIKTIDVGGVQTKITPTVFNDTDKGMAPGAISTSKGVFYGVQGAGFYQLLSGGAVNQPFSRQEKKISINLDKDYFEDVNMDNLSILM